MRWEYLSRYRRVTSINGIEYRYKYKQKFAYEKNYHFKSVENEWIFQLI